MNRIITLLFALIRAFKIDLAVSAKDLGNETGEYQNHPVLLLDPIKMPLFVRPSGLACNAIPKRPGSVQGCNY
jgi:hypothetical protein